MNRQWHDCIALCTSTSHDMGVSAWERSTLCLVLMVGSITWDDVQNESHGFEVIREYPVLLK